MKVLSSCFNNVNFCAKPIGKILPHGRPANEIHVPGSILYKKPTQPSREHRIPVYEIPPDAYRPQSKPPAIEEKRGVFIEPMSGENPSNVFKI